MVSGANGPSEEEAVNSQSNLFSKVDDSEFLLSQEIEESSQPIIDLTLFDEIVVPSGENLKLKRTNSQTRIPRTRKSKIRERSSYQYSAFNWPIIRSSRQLHTTVRSQRIQYSGQFSSGVPVRRIANKVGRQATKSIPGVRACKILHSGIFTMAMVYFEKGSFNPGFSNLRREQKRFQHGSQFF